MGLGKLLLDRLGMRMRYQPLFERMMRFGATGLGYGAPTVGNQSKKLEETAFAMRRKPAKGEREVIFDVGANRGLYMDMVRRVSSPASLVLHAFEPDTVLSAELRERFADDPNVHVVSKGLSEIPGTAVFHKHAQDDLSSFHVAQDHPTHYRNTSVSSSFEVPLTSIDAYCTEHSIAHIHHLKIDTEGHDLHVLRGARNMLQERRIDNIQFEFSEMNLLSHTTFFEHWSLLHEHYDIHRMCYDGFYRIEAYDPLLHEAYYVVNFFAILRA